MTERILTLLCLCGISASTANAAAPPSVLLVLCDDLGYGDLGCYGNELVKTPNIDAFARTSLRFTDCYSSHPNCSPSRTGLMTGRTPYRIGIHNWIPMLSPMHVPTSEVTIAEVLKSQGYDTALCGKWHLNGRFNLPDQPQPGDMGFNHWFATQNNCLPNHQNPYNFVRNGIPLGPLKGFAADLVASEAIHWLRSLRNKEKPFFLFVSFHEPHEPIATAPRFKDLYGDLHESQRAHHGNISQMDAAFGRLMQALKKQNLDKETLVIFTSDNGPAKTSFHPDGSAGPLKDKKGFIGDGGIRVPGIIHWHEKIPMGESAVPIIGTDFFPTLCDLAGARPPTDIRLDGTSLRPLFEGKPLQREHPLYWHFYGAQGAAKVAIREGRWKLTAEMDAPPARDRGGINAQDQQTIKTAKLTNLKLFDMENDIAEESDVQTSEPEIFARLSASLLKLYAEVQAESPVWPAWEFAGYESQRIQWPPYRGKRSVPHRTPIVPPVEIDNPLIETIE